MDFFLYEDANAPVWVPNQVLERTLRRRPTTMRAWLQERREQFFPDNQRKTTLNNSSQGTPAAAGTWFDGLWECTIATPMGKEPHELVLRSAPDGTLSGEMKNVKNGISMPLQDGRYNDNVLTWTLQVTKPISITLKVEVQVNGDELTGHGSAGLMGKVPIRGNRRA